MDRYEKLRLLGKGAFGQAVLVKDTVTSELRVVKIMELDSLRTNAARNEVSLLASIDHPNVVKYYDSFDENGALHIVMEFCEGGDLSAVVSAAAPQLDEQKVWDYFVQLCLAIKYLHDRKIIHRDIKPANIFLTGEDKVKLGDFGVSKGLDEGIDTTKTVIGTVSYLPPEMIDNQPYNSSCDVWALGCILYEMAARRPAFQAVAMLMHIQLGASRQSLKPLPREYGDEMKAMIENLLEVDPTERPTIDEVLANPVLERAKRKYIPGGQLTRQQSVEEEMGFAPAAGNGAEQILREWFDLHINEQGKLVNDDGSGFKFRVSGNVAEDQERYNRVGQLMEWYIYEQLESLLGPRRYLHGDENGTFIFASDGYERADKLLVLICGSGTVKAGQWSRKLIINDCLESGSQLPYIQMALRHEWHVLVMNPNDIRYHPALEGCHSPLDHGLYVWKHYIANHNIRQIAIVAHSSGGSITNHILENNLEHFRQKVYAIALTDTLGNIPKTVKDYLPYVSTNWVVRKKPLGHVITKKGMIQRSAGTLEHSRTSHQAMDEVFTFIQERFADHCPGEPGVDVEAGHSGCVLQ